MVDLWKGIYRQFLLAAFFTTTGAIFGIPLVGLAVGLFILLLIEISPE